MDFTKTKTIIDGYEVDTYKTDIEGICSIEVEAGTNCPKGGDTGHGGRTFITLRDICCTDMRVSVHDSYGRLLEEGDADEVTISFGGDEECRNLIEALEFALKALTGNLEKEQNVENLPPKEQKKVYFNQYLNELAEHYRKTGSLKNMSAIRSKYPVQGITKEQFFECGVHLAAKDNVKMDMAFTNDVYTCIKSKDKSVTTPYYPMYHVEDLQGE